MRRFKVASSIGVCAAAALLQPARPAAAQVPVGRDFPLAEAPTTTVYRQEPQVVSQPGGGFVVSFIRTHFEFPVPQVEQSLVGGRYDAAGQQQGAEFVIVPSFERGIGSVLAPQPDGFLAAWMEGGGQDSTVWGRRFDPAGAPRGAPFVVDTVTAARHEGLAVGPSPGGGFVVAWAVTSNYPQPNRVRGRRFDAAGAPLGGAFPITDTAARTFTPGVAVAGDGTFVVVWGTYGGGVGFVRARRFGAAGAPITGELQVNAPDDTRPGAAGVASDADGNFAVVWRGLAGVKLSRFRADGVPLGAAVPVVSEPLLQGLSMAAGRGGDFVVAWEEWRGFESDVFARRFDAAGNAGPAFRVASSAASYQVLPEAALHDDGRMVVVWDVTESIERARRPVARRFGDLGPDGGTADPSPRATSNGNGVLEPGESVVYAPAWRNAGPSPQSLTGQASGFTGPPGGTYTLVDAAAHYPPLAPGESRACLAAGDCYELAVAAAARPAPHWDAALTEEVNGTHPEAIVHAVHVGGSFADVAAASPYVRFVETLFHHGISGGCGGARFCPEAPTTRAQAGVLALRSAEPTGFAPRDVCYADFPRFRDVPSSSPYCVWIEELARRGITAGCGSGNFCPEQALSRQEAAVLLLRLRDAALTPPACVPGQERFRDVPAASPFCPWVEELARRGVASGCGGGDFCPNAAVTRAAMSVFLVQTYGLQLY